jgi:L-ascorbate metabolism protein UlaG (beta-lactamase superfamily)
MLDNLHWLGHSGFRLEGLKTIYFDPYQLPKNPVKADIVLITHEHDDHYSPENLKLISSRGTVIVTDRAVGKKIQDANLVCRDIKVLSPGEDIDVYSVKINAVASYNTNKHFHSRNSKKLGFIVMTDGLRIYHAGDTDMIPEMRNYECDIALLPVSGIYVMTAEEAARAVLAIKPKLAIPMHYGSVAGSNDDAIRFQDLLRGKVEVKILEKES